MQWVANEEKRIKIDESIFTNFVRFDWTNDKKRSTNEQVRGGKNTILHHLCVWMRRMFQAMERGGCFKQIRINTL